MDFRSLLPALAVLGALTVTAQDDADKRIQELQHQYDELEKQQQALLGPLEEAKLRIMQRDLARFGLPALASGDEVTVHPGHSLVWSERYHEPKWTAHIVTPDITRGNLARVDTFLPDPQVHGNTDLFKVYWNSGYDRGHQVPSADMRWSQQALNATYLYSNICPQKPELNRGSWADLEDWVRRYVHYAGHRVFVVTGPVLREGLATITKPDAGVNVSVPEYCFKAIMDMDGDKKQGIAFIMRNGVNDHAVTSYSVPIDSVERMTGLDLFPAIDDATEASIEAMNEPKDWMAKGDPGYGDAQPLKAPLPGGRFNTTQAKYHVGQTATICGTVVSTRRTQKANALYLNLDRNHPNQEFYATVWDYNGPNFHYDPETYLVNKKVCITGKVTLYDEIPRISVNNETEITFWDDIIKGAK
jgi:endonuclease G